MWRVPDRNPDSQSAVTHSTQILIVAVSVSDAVSMFEKLTVLFHFFLNISVLQYYVWCLYPDIKSVFTDKM